MGYIRGTRHQNQSDFPLFVPSLMKMTKMAGPLPAETAIHLNNRACLTFLGWHAPDQTVRALRACILSKTSLDSPMRHSFGTTSTSSSIATTPIVHRRLFWSRLRVRQ